MCWYARVTFRCGCQTTRFPEDIPNAAKAGFRYYGDSGFLLLCEGAAVVNQPCPKYDIYPHQGFSTHLKASCLGCLAEAFQPKLTDDGEYLYPYWEFRDYYSDELPAEEKQSAFHDLLNSEPTDQTESEKQTQTQENTKDDTSATTLTKQ